MVRRQCNPACLLTDGWREGHRGTFEQGLLRLFCVCEGPGCEVTAVLLFIASPEPVMSESRSYVSRAGKGERKTLGHASSKVDSTRVGLAIFVLSFVMASLR